MTASKQPSVSYEEVPRKASRYILEELGNRLWAGQPAYDERLQRWTVPIHSRALPADVVLGIVLLDVQGVVIQAPSRRDVQSAIEQHQMAAASVRHPIELLEPASGVQAAEEPLLDDRGDPRETPP